MRIKIFLKITTKRFLLNLLNQKYKKGKPSGFISRRAFRNELFPILEQKVFTEENSINAKKYLTDFLCYKNEKSNIDLKSDVFIAIYPSNIREHMSNHVVRDFVSLLQQNGMTCYEVYGKEELDTFNIAKILRQSNMTLNSANVRIISVMDISRELERKISKLKIESCGNAQIILLVNDLWRNRDIVTFQDKFEFADYFFHMDPYAIQGLSRVHQSKCHFFPFAGLNQSIFFPDSKKEVIFFSGNVNSSYRRKFIDALLSNFRGSYLRVQINGFHYLQRSRIPTMQDYAKQLNRARICLDLGKKEDRYWVLTGRSLEALASGCFLILDEPKTGGPLSLLFTKGVHYKSFESIEELIDLVREFDVNIQLATNIASAAHARYLELFNHKRLVGYLDEILRREFNSLID